MRATAGSVLTRSSPGRERRSVRSAMGDIIDRRSRVPDGRRWQRTSLHRVNKGRADEHISQTGRASPCPTVFRRSLVRNSSRLASPPITKRPAGYDQDIGPVGQPITDISRSAMPVCRANTSAHAASGGVHPESKPAQQAHCRSARCFWRGSEKADEPSSHLQPAAHPHAVLPAPTSRSSPRAKPRPGLHVRVSRISERTASVVAPAVGPSTASSADVQRRYFRLLLPRHPQLTQNVPVVRRCSTRDNHVLSNRSSVEVHTSTACRCCQALLPPKKHHLHHTRCLAVIQTS